MWLDAKSVCKVLGPVVVLCLTAFSVAAQACGPSWTTFYVENEDGKRLRNVRIRFIKEYSDHMNSSFFYWDEALEAHAIFHSLCGDHPNVTVKFSSEGYKTVTQTIDIPIGSRGYTLKLFRKGSTGQGTLNEISCKDGPLPCVKRVRP